MSNDFVLCFGIWREFAYIYIEWVGKIHEFS
jgi:hypothetical protein